MLLRIFRNIKNEIFLYFIYLVELSLTFLILFISISTVSESIRDYFKLRTNDYSYTIRISLKEDVWEDKKSFDYINWLKEPSLVGDNKNYPFSYEDLLFFQNDDIELDGNISFTLNFFHSEKGWKNFFITFSSKATEVTMTKEFYDLWNSDYTCFNGKEFPFVLENKYLIHGTNKYKLHFTNQKEPSVSLPLSLYFEFFHYKDVPALNIAIHTAKVQPIEMMSAIHEYINYLNAQHTDYKYSMNNELYASASITYISNSIMKNVLLGAILLLVILTLGMLCMILSVVEQRKHKIAIHRTLGASVNQIFIEIMLELECIIICGFLIGSSAGIYFIRQKIVVFGLTINYQPSCLLYLFLIALCMTFFIAIPIYQQLKNYNIHNELSNE